MFVLIRYSTWFLDDPTILSKHETDFFESKSDEISEPNQNDKENLPVNKRKEKCKSKKKQDENQPPCKKPKTKKKVSPTLSNIYQYIAYIELAFSQSSKLGTRSSREPQCIFGLFGGQV
jgi:ribosomal protein S30